MTLKRKTRNAVGGKKAAKAARKKTSARSRRAKGAKVGAAKLARRGSRAARAKNAARRRPARRSGVTRRRNLFGFGGGDDARVRIKRLSANDLGRLSRKEHRKVDSAVRKAVRRAEKEGKEVKGITVYPDVDVDYNPRSRNGKLLSFKKPGATRDASARAARKRVLKKRRLAFIDRKIDALRSRLRKVSPGGLYSAERAQARIDKRPKLAKQIDALYAKRGRMQNAFGLDRFIGRKKRVTSESYRRAGTSRRSRAYQRAGVPKKLSSTYANLDWKELQQLDPGFVKKVMRSLNPRSLKKLRSAISSKIRQLRKEGVPQKQSVAIALREARSGYLKPKGAYRRRSRRNPDSGIPPGPERAGEKYAMFHGRGPSRVVEVKELAPKDMAALGDLESLILGNKDYQIHWGKGERPMLAMDADCDQLYIVGGNQALPDSLLSDLGVRGKVDVVDLGEINQIEYFTQKGFDNFRPIVYYHQFGEEDAKKNPRKVRRPRLLYSRRYKKLMLAGGGYKIKKEGIIN